MEGISAIIATYKRKAELEKLLQSFVLNKYPAAEIIIVDQNPDNLIDDLISSYRAALEIKHLKLNVPNQSLARNYGVKEATYPVICFPDDDCWFDNDTLQKVSDHFSTHTTTDLLIVNWKQNQRPGGAVSQPLGARQICSFKAPVHYGTIVLFFKRESFIRIGGFNESIGLGFYIGGGEDSELMFRAANQNLNIYYDAGIYINHNYTPLVTRDLQSIRSRQRAIGFIYIKCRVSAFVLVRGVFSPLLNMFVCFNQTAIKAHYHTLMGRLEGLVYGFRN